MVDSLPPVGPPTGPLNPVTGPIQSYVPVDIVSPAGKLKYQFNTSAQRPTLSTLDALKMVGEAKIEDTKKQFESEAQQAALRRDFYQANADNQLSSSQRGELLLQITINQLTLSILQSTIISPIQSIVDVENAQVPIENLLISQLNTAMTDWNTARSNYINNPTPANLAALTTATSNYTLTRNSYESYRSTRNAQINAYNASVTSAQNSLNTDVHPLIADINADRAALGMPLITPATYDLFRDLLPASPATPDISVPANLPPPLNTITDIRTPVDITVTPIDTVLSSFITDIIAASELMRDTSTIGRQYADETARQLDWKMFFLKQENNPTVLNAWNKVQPKNDTKAAVGPETNGAGMGSSSIIAAISTPPGNPSLLEAPGIANFSAQSSKESIVDTPKDLEAKLTRINADLNGIGSVRLQDIKLVAAIDAREKLGTGFGINNPALRTILGLNTVNGIQTLVSSGNIEKTVGDVISKNYSDNPELEEATRVSLTAALKVQYQFIAANELAQALGDPDIAAQLLLATPGLEQLRTLLPGSSTVGVEDLLSGPYNQAYLGVNLTDLLAKNGDLDQNEAAALASDIVNELNKAPIENLEELKRMLLELLQQSLSANVASTIVNGILNQASQDRNVASLNRPLLVEAIRREAIIDQVTADAAEKAALLNAFNSTYATAEEFRKNAAESLGAIGLSQEKANLLAENAARISILDSNVLLHLKDRLKQINNPAERNRIENEFLSTINVPQKVKVEEKEARVNPLSIPNQIAHQLEILKDRGADKVVDAVIDDSKRAARIDYGDFVQRHRAEDLGRIYLHQTMEAGGPYADKSALPRNNFTQPALAIGPVTMAA